MEWKQAKGDITREHVSVHQRVVRVCDIIGSTDDTIVVSSDLNQLECVMDAVNPLAKSFPDDAENAADATKQTKVYGLIKLMIENVKHVTIVVQAKLITGTIEMHQCEHVKLILQHDSISTLQVDICDNCQVEFATVNQWNPHNRILHAGCSNMRIIHKDQSIDIDYEKDGAKTVGNASPKEYQFITSQVKGKFLTESVATTGNGVPMTQREVDEAAANRKKVMDKAIAMADKMVQLKDKDGNPLVTKETSDTATGIINTAAQEIERLKSQGNEAFGMGEYAQAILHYSLALDKTAELESSCDITDILYSNRAAAFLKLGQHEKALSDADAALEFNPNNLKASFRKGLALHASGEYAIALPILAQAHKTEPKNQQIKQALQFCEVRLEQEHRKRMQQ